MLRGGPQRVGGARPAQGLGPQAQAALRKAWDLRKTDPAASATELERMARIAGERDMPGMAAHLSLEAARSSRAAGQGDGANRFVEAAVDYAAKSRNTSKAARKLGSYVSELRTAGDAGAADALESTIKSRLGVSSLPTGPTQGGINRSARRTMPRSCATCAGPVDYDPEYGEDGVPDCRYCGTGLLG
jgi:hypothetical protein